MTERRYRYLIASTDEEVVRDHIGVGKVGNMLVGFALTAYL